MNIDRRSFLAGLATLPLIPACSDTAETKLAPPASVSEVKILSQSWGTSQLIAKIAELLIREQLGISAQTSVRAEAEIWPLLEKGEAHACLEVWPLRNGEGVTAYVDSGKVENLGSLGAGRGAWFVPDYVADLVPEIMTPTVPSAMQALLTKAKITQLLVGPTDWITPTPARMSALGLASLPVQQAGTEKALLDQIRQAFDNRVPFMASLWYPHPLHALYGLRAVGLPAAAGCNVTATPFGCDYPAEPLMKAGWPGLKFSDRQVHAFLTAFSPPLDDMIGLLAASEDSREVLARNWIKTRNVVWTPWINAARSAT